MMYIGIDPGLHNTGIAIVSGGTFRDQYTGPFWEAIRWVVSYIGSDKGVFYIEAPQENSPVFRRSGEQWNVTLKRAQNIGMNKACAILIAQYFESRGYTVHRVRPKKGSTAKRIPSNIIHNTVGAKMSSHARDALWLVWGR